MINLKLFKKNPNEIKNKIIQKDPSFEVDALFILFHEHNQVIFEISQLQEKINKLSALFLKKNNNSEEIKNEVKAIKLLIQEKTIQSDEIESIFNVLLLSCPNLIQDGIPIGGKESNQVIKTVGVAPIFDFPIKNISLGIRTGCKTKSAIYTKDYKNVIVQCLYLTCTK